MRKSHLCDRVWLLRCSTVLALELRERYRLCAWTIFETDHGSLSIGWLKGPRLGQVCQVHQLSGVKSRQATRQKRNTRVREKRAHRTTESGELPIQDPDHAVLRRVKDKVVEFIVAVHDPHASRLALVWQVPLVPRYELVPPWDVAYRLARLDVLHRGLGARDF